jgi:transposase InsO family protein
MSHANARLTVHGRRLLCERVAAGHRVADVAAQLGCSRTTVYKWLRRHRLEGETGLWDRSSRPRTSPGRIACELERAIIELRRSARRGQDWIAAELGVCARTVGRVIVRAGLPALSRLDALTGEPVRSGPMSPVRYERERPGELVHVDVKRLGRIPPGGGWRVHGRGPKPAARRRQGFDYVHSAIDDRTRLAYSEIHSDERGETCAGFLARAAAFFAEHGITRIERVMTDNHFSYRLSDAFAETLAAIGARQVLIRPHCPWTNGKVERFNRTLLREWAYSRPFASNDERARSLPQWLCFYNERRRHSALGGLPPISRVSTTW